MVRIKNNVTINDIEKLYRQASANEQVDIILPTKFEQQDFSLAPQLIQFISSVLAGGSENRLILDVDSQPSLDEALQILRDPIVFVSILYSWNKDILNNKNESVKRAFWDARDETLSQMQQLTYGRGTKTLSACFDHLPLQLGLLKAWYSADEFITTERDLDGYIDKTLSKVGSFSPTYLKRSMVSILGDLEGILYELIKNTDEHARTDENGNAINPNSRGVICTFHKNSKAALEKSYSAHPGIKKYLANIDIKPNEIGDVMFLEISVFDTGPGLVKQYSKIDPRNMSLETEVEQLKECLAKNCTSATGEAKIKKGKGLDRVLSTLNEKGFIKIRSGRICLFRDLVTVPYENVESPGQIKIFDWLTNSEKQITQLSMTSGTVISMFYPIDAQPIQVEEKDQQIPLF